MKHEIVDQKATSCRLRSSAHRFVHKSHEDEVEPCIASRLLLFWISSDPERYPNKQRYCEVYGAKVRYTV
jgi:hypothetical protein